MKGKYVLLEDFVEFFRMIDILLVDIFFEENKMKCHKLYKWIKKLKNFLFLDLIIIIYTSPFFRYINKNL